MPCAQEALSLCSLINDCTVQRSRRRGALRSEIKEEGRSPGGHSRSKAPRRRERAPNSSASTTKQSRQSEAQAPNPIDWRATARKAWKLCANVFPLVSTDRSAFE
jgi:hypothetical protein